MRDWSVQVPDNTAPADRLFHIGYVVRDMTAALQKWQRMGAQILVPPAVDPIQNVVCSLLSYKSSSIPIELVSPADDGRNPLESRLAKGGGLDHLCFFSDDLDVDLSNAISEGGVIAVEACYGAVFDRNIAFVVTRAGLVVEFMTRQPVGRVATDPLSTWLTR